MCDSFSNNYGSPQIKNLIQISLGRTKYKRTWDIQKELVELRASGKIPDCLIVTEHEPVITMGRGTDKKNLLVSPETLSKQKVDLYEVERGGDITFHGPGQTVLNPIIDLRNRNRDGHRFLRDLEAVAIKALGKIGLNAEIKEGLTGIWVSDHKVGAIGVAVSKWITYHGIAINVTTDLDYFRLINPCGITRYPVGSIAGLLNRNIEMDEVNVLLTESLAHHFDYNDVIAKNINDLIE